MTLAETHPHDTAGPNVGQVVPSLTPTHDAILTSLPADAAQRLVARVG